jgi:hypothetical protein
MRGKSGKAETSRRRFALFCFRFPAFPLFAFLST